MIFMNTSDPYRLLLNLADEMDLRKGDNGVALSGLSVYYTWKNSTETLNSKYCEQHGLTNLNWQIDLFCIRFWGPFWAHHQKSWNMVGKPLVQIYVKNIQNRITVMINYGCSLDIRDYLTTWKYWKKNNQGQKWWDCAKTRIHGNGVSLLQYCQWLMSAWFKSLCVYVF